MHSKLEEKLPEPTPENYGPSEEEVQDALNHVKRHGNDDSHFISEQEFFDMIDRL